ncbi:MULTISPECIES: HNH endonuclease [unclassified Tenacibaculum]|uniref:HNH endonuclease n=1 Tax=unclassified Tenacibaculum TaxID=2635139 RepID=UPI001F3E883F|nr:MULTISPECIES: DUF3427 domain-containing protein [unclassified Tenacibaculum]MCF2874307.1 HNH endonuclease [Tenacibaculum sp. Cn5-1]MCF2934888.1 HNH endonuclease [Tenacibaculum sp. Cn5-34]MCG7511098.1 HNH endonuclease [Tenacibaculum sp. Cn5-46]
MQSLKIGKGYNKVELAQLINEPQISKLQAGLHYCKNRNATIFFVTLDKKAKEEQLHYNDFFSDNYFEWDSQNRQSFDDPRIQAIYKGTVNVYLMVRVYDKIKGKTQPFIYCGELKYYSHDVTTSKPVHITFLCKDYQFESQNEKLIELYNWKPKDINTSSFKPDYKKPITPKRKATYKKPDITERKGMVNSRVGQGYYREQILEKWNYKCAITESNIYTVLIASHIVPWKDATEEERLDPENGILLSPNYDALFDKHLITFEENGSILFSSSIDIEELKKLGIQANAKIKVNDEMKPYLKKHRALLK